ncbi:MAG: ABC transporter ATP-binding protein [Candidatus Limnocylindrales bacterium]
MAGRDRSTRGPFQRVLERLVRAPLDAASFIPAAPPVAIRTIVRRFWPFLRPYRRWVVVGLIPLAILPLIETFEIWLFQIVVDDVLTPADLSLLPMLAAAFIGLVLASAVLSYVDDVVGTYVSERFTLGVRRSLYQHLLRQSPDALDRRHLGDTLARVSGDVAAVEGLMVSAPGEIVSAVVRAILFSGAMFLIDPLLAVISLVLAPLFWGAARLFASAARDLARERRRRRGGVMALAEESLSHAPLIQATGREADELARFDAEGEVAADAEVASARLNSMLMPLVDFVEVIGALVITGLGTLALADGRLSLGELLVFLTYLSQLYRPVRDLAELTTAAFTASGGAERILEVLDEEPSIAERPDAVDPGRAHGLVRLEQVGYAYPGGEPVLSGISVEFEPGSMTAVVGPSGAGKSTLVKLLLRFIDPSEGRVLLDGRDIRGLTLRGFRRNIAVQFQDPHILDASLVENVRYARPGATDAEVRAALEAADAAGFSETLGDGHATRLAQHGRRLSGGQRARVEIARLLVQDAPVVVLDEPTAALDAETSRKVMRALRVLLRGRTVIVITHDPVALEVADRIMGLESGRMVSVTSALAAATRESGASADPARDAVAHAARSAA